MIRRLPGRELVELLDARLQGRGPGARARLGCAVLALVGAWPAAADPGRATRDLAGAVEPGRAAASPARLDRDLAEIEEVLASAHFRTALALAEAARGRLDAMPAEPAPALWRARLEVLVATAELALGRRRQARGSMARALRADPGLTLDEARVSPKVVALLRDVRAAEPAP